MAAILRSSVTQTARRAFSGERTLSVRALYPGRNNPMAYASFAKQTLKPSEVDLSAKPTLGRRSSRYSKRPMKKENDSKAVPWLLATFVVLAFLEGVEGEVDDVKAKRN